MAINAALQAPAARLLKADRGEHFDLGGHIVRIIVSGAQTGGLIAAGELSVAAGFGPPPHVHPHHELFYITQGEIEVGMSVNGAWTTATAGPGTFVYIPGMAPHGFRGIAPNSRFFGAVWDASLEAFFRAAGLPCDHLLDFHEFDPANAGEMIELLGRYGVAVIDPAQPPQGEPLRITPAQDIVPRELLGKLLRVGLRGSACHGTTAVEVTALSGHDGPMLSYSAGRIMIVLDGEFDFETVTDGGRKVQHALAGDALFVPAGTPCRYRNALERPSRLLNLVHADGPHGLEGLLDEVTTPVTDWDAALAGLPSAPASERLAAMRPALESHGMRLHSV